MPGEPTIWNMFVWLAWNCAESRGWLEKKVVFQVLFSYSLRRLADEGSRICSLIQNVQFIFSRWSSCLGLTVEEVSRLRDVSVRLLFSMRLIVFWRIFIATWKTRTSKRFRHWKKLLNFVSLITKFCFDVWSRQASKVSYFIAVSFLASDWLSTPKQMLQLSTRFLMLRKCNWPRTNLAAWCKQRNGKSKKRLLAIPVLCSYLQNGLYP